MIFRVEERHRDDVAARAVSVAHVQDERDDLK